MAPEGDVPEGDVIMVVSSRGMARRCGPEPLSRRQSRF
jgi:hypothetical protein